MVTGPIEVLDGGGRAAIGRREFRLWVDVLPELKIAVEAMNEGMKVAQPEREKMKVTIKIMGTTVIGTVFGDIHDIGKSIDATMLEMNRLRVVYLGVNVPSSVFVQKVREVKPQVLDLSTLLATTMRER